MSWQDVLAEALPAVSPAPEIEALSLDADPRSVSVARRFVAQQTEALDSVCAEDLRLVTSELVTNAVVHARTKLQVAVVVTDDAVVVMTHDLDLGRREERTVERDGGRGLAIVAQLACASGMVRHPEGGKTSWARLCRNPRRAAS